MTYHTQLILSIRSRSHRHGLKETRRFRDLVSTDETCSIVDLALVRAAEAYDPKRNVPFFCYARVWIRRELAKAVRVKIAERERMMRRTMVDSAYEQTLDDTLMAEQLLQRLEPVERRVVRAHVIEGHSLADVARRNNRHRAWACRLLKRALTQLRESMNRPESFQNA